MKQILFYTILLVSLKSYAQKCHSILVNGNPSYIVRCNVSKSEGGFNLTFYTNKIIKDNDVVAKLTIDEIIADVDAYKLTDDFYINIKDKSDTASLSDIMSGIMNGDEMYYYTEKDSFLNAKEWTKEESIIVKGTDTLRNIKFFTIKENKFYEGETAQENNMVIKATELFNVSIGDHKFVVKNDSFLFAEKAKNLQLDTTIKDTVEILTTKIIETVDESITSEEFSAFYDYSFNSINLKKSKEDKNAEKLYNCVKTEMQVYDLRKELQDAENERDPVGTFALTKEKINVYCDNAAAKKVKITEVTMAMKDGFLFDILIKTEKGIFYLNRPLTPRYINTYKRPYRCYITNKENENDQSYILLKDAISFTGIPGRFYHPEDQEITLTNEKNTLTVNQNLAPSQIFTVALFSDILSLANFQKNGIIENEITLQLRPNTRNLGKSTAIPFHTLHFKANLVRFSEGNVPLYISGPFDIEANTSDSVKTVQNKEYISQTSPLTLYQRCKAKFEMSLGLINKTILGFRAKEPHKFFLNAYYSAGFLNAVRVIDTPLTQPTTLFISNYGLRAGVHMRFSKNLWSQYSYSFSMQTVNNYKQGNTPVLEKILYSPNTFLQQHECRISYKPTGQANSNLFVKFAFTSIFDNKPIRKLYKDDANNYFEERKKLSQAIPNIFYQMQVGYNLDIADFFSKIKTIGK